MMISQDLKVYLRYAVDEFYRFIIFMNASFGDDELLAGKEYRVVGLSGAVGEVVIWTVKNRVILSLAPAYGFTADITLPDNTAP